MEHKNRSVNKSLKLSNFPTYCPICEKDKRFLQKITAVIHDTVKGCAKNFYDRPLYKTLVTNTKERKNITKIDFTVMPSSRFEKISAEKLQKGIIPFGFDPDTAYVKRYR